MRDSHCLHLRPAERPGQDCVLDRFERPFLSLMSYSHGCVSTTFSARLVRLQTSNALTSRLRLATLVQGRPLFSVLFALIMYEMLHILILGVKPEPATSLQE